MPKLRLAVLLSAWLLILVGSGLAASPLVEVKDLKQPVAAGSPTTYADLLQLVFPEPAGAEKEGKAERETAPVRQLDDDYEKQPLPAQNGFEGVRALPLEAEGQPLLLLNVSATGKEVQEGSSATERHYNLLALFQTGPTPKLLDLVDISSPVIQGSGFWCKNPRFNLTPSTQACMIFQEHFNSSQSYLQIRLLWVRNQRLEELMGVSPFSNKSLCETFRSKAVFWTEPDNGREFPKVVAKLTLKMEPSPKDDQCQTPRRGFTKSYQGAW